MSESLKADADLPPISRTADVESRLQQAEVSDTERAEAQLMQRLAGYRFDLDNEPDSGRVLFQIGGREVATGGNLVALTAHAKAGKSALFTGAIAAALAEGEFLHCSSPVQHGAVIHLDTEQSERHHWLLCKRILDRANLSVVDPRFNSYRVRDFTVSEKARALRVAVEKAAAENDGNVHSIWLDGVADFVTDVNDAKESDEFIGELMGLSTRYDCIIACILHLNPGSSFKSRGHLGSSLERKAEANIVLNKDGQGVTSVWGDKMRGAPILEKDALHFEWDEELGRHEVCDAPVKTPGNNRGADWSFGLNVAWSLVQDRAWMLGELAQEVCREIGSKSVDRARTMIADHVVEKGEGAFVELTAAKSRAKFIGPVGLVEDLKAKYDADFEKKRQQSLKI